MSAVRVSLADLENGLSPETLAAAFGPDSLGIILVDGLPAFFPDLRMKVLLSISDLAHLPPPELEKLESSESLWLTGWSCGKEILASSGKPDFHKGSYYVNCAFYADESLEGPRPNLVEKFATFKTYTMPNIWPPIAGFKENTKLLCRFIILVAQKVATNCDAFVAGANENYDRDFLERTVSLSTCSKARLLHYFPRANTSSSSEDDWCGEHLDHSCITGLTSALYFDEKEQKPLTALPDPEAGLYIRNRKNEVVQVNIPADCLAFQTGSALQEVTSNSLKAVPHYVKGTSLPNIARNTLAVFCQPDLDERMNDRENFAQFSQRVVEGNH